MDKFIHLWRNIKILYDLFQVTKTMADYLIVILCAIGAVAFFVVAMSLTLMIKGHYIDGEISTNKNMQKLGIRCAVQETREEDGSADCHDVGCSGNCAGCDVEHDKLPKKE